MISEVGENLLHYFHQSEKTHFASYQIPLVPGTWFQRRSSRGFYHNWVWWPSWSTVCNHLNKLNLLQTINGSGVICSELSLEMWFKNENSQNLESDVESHPSTMTLTYFHVLSIYAKYDTSALISFWKFIVFFFSIFFPTYMQRESHLIFILKRSEVNQGSHWEQFL